MYTPHFLIMHAPLSCLLSKEELFVCDTTALLRRKHTASEVTIYERQGLPLVWGPWTLGEAGGCGQGRGLQLPVVEWQSGRHTEYWGSVSDSVVTTAQKPKKSNEDNLHVQL